MAATNMQALGHVDYLWDHEHATALGEDQVALFLYRSDLLGADLRITNYIGFRA
jgi:rhamnose utilization protein RhaD (predicted bifunctional aldolase and dehydrogenase)